MPKKMNLEHIDPDDVILRVSEVQELIRLGENKTRDLMRRQVIPCVIVGRCYLTTRKTVLRWLVSSLGHNID